MGPEAREREREETNQHHLSKLHSGASRCWALAVTDISPLPTWPSGSNIWGLHLGPVGVMISHRCSLQLWYQVRSRLWEPGDEKHPDPPALLAGSLSCPPETHLPSCRVWQPQDTGVLMGQPCFSQVGGHSSSAES